MVKKIYNNKKIQKEIAKVRIEKLFYMAECRALEGRQNLADRYVEIARKLSMRYLTPIPKRFKRNYCKHCYSYLLPGSNCRVRIYRGRCIVFCNNCQRYMRFILKK